MNAFSQELRSKRIYRIAGGYVVSAWLVLQVASVIAPSLGLPAWTLRALVGILLLGFSVALFAGWHLDVRAAAMIDRRQGRWEKSTAGLEKAVALDPRSPELLESLADNYTCLRRYRDAERMHDRLIVLKPDEPLFRILKAENDFAEKGS